MTFTAYMLDVLTDSVYPARITIKDGKFDEIVPIVTDMEIETDIDGLIIPGFIDSHIHIESTMLTPAQFAKIAVKFGTTSVVCDPHEMANVCGMEGIDFMVENSKTVPLNFYFGAPSCVPTTPFETAGACLNSDDIEELLKRDEFVCLSEMMNALGVINGDPEVLKKLEIARKLNKPIDGHAPQITGKDLDKYIEQGIITDHECVSFQEAIEKKQKGMKIMVREGSSARNLEALFDFSERLNYWRNQDSFGIIPTDVLERRIHLPIFDFIVSDDISTGELVNGYFDKILKKTNELEVDIIKAIEMITINPASHYNLNAGAIVTGSAADFIIIDNLKDFNILETYIAGECVFDGENVLFDVEDVEFKNEIIVEKKQASDFQVNYDGERCEVNVIKCFNGELITEKSSAVLAVENGIIQPDISGDILKIAVVERYGGNTVANAFINGFNLKKGAIATSVSHDSHNIIVVGTNSEDMARAVNLIIDGQGGLAAVNGNSQEFLPLPIAGLMTNKDAYSTTDKLFKLRSMAKSFGCNLDAPFLTLGFMALLVIPSIKLSNLGLFDGDAFEFMDLIKN